MRLHAAVQRQGQLARGLVRHEQPAADAVLLRVRARARVRVSGMQHGVGLELGLVACSTEPAYLHAGGVRDAVVEERWPPQPVEDAVGLASGP